MYYVCYLYSLLAQDSLSEQVEGLRRENKQLAQEIRELQVYYIMYNKNIEYIGTG